MNKMFLSAGLVGILSISCAQFSELAGLSPKKKPEIKPSPSGLKAYQKAGGRIAGMGMDEAQVRVSAGSAAPSSALSGITPDADIVWAPENPNEAIGGGLDVAWEKPENKSWHTRYSTASRLSKRSGKPMLIWFTDSARSPLCRRLSDELFSRPDFESWAAEKIVRLRVDSTIKIKNREQMGLGKYEDLKTRKNDYVKRLKKRYSVHGHPTVILLSPSGKVLQKYRGYKKGNAEYYWGRLKHVVSNAEEDYGKWRERMEARGYRVWTSRDGQKIFAKLYRFASGKVTLIDPDGKRGKTSMRNLSDADQTWILNEKKKHDAQ